MKRYLITPIILISISFVDISFATSMCRSLIEAEVRPVEGLKKVQFFQQPIDYDGREFWFRPDPEGLNCDSLVSGAFVLYDLSFARIENPDSFRYFHEVNQEDFLSGLMAEGLRLIRMEIDFADLAHDLKSVISDDVFEGMVVSAARDFLSDPRRVTDSGFRLSMWGRMTEKVFLPQDVLDGLRGLDLYVKSPGSVWPFLFTIDDFLTRLVIFYQRGLDVKEDLDAAVEFVASWYSGMPEDEKLDAFPFHQGEASGVVSEVVEKMRQGREVFFGDVPIFFSGY